LAAARDGGLVVAGTFAGEVDFGRGKLASPTGTIGFAVGLDAHGLTTWSRRFADRHGFAGASDVAVDSRGHAWIAGRFFTAIDLGDDVPLAAVDPASGSAFLLELDAGGAHVWHRALGRGLTLAAATDGALLVAGTTTSPVELAGTELRPTKPRREVAFLAKLDETHTVVWARSLGQGASCAPRVAADSLGGGAVVVTCSGPFDLDGRIVEVETKGGLVLSFHPDGHTRFARSLDGLGLNGSLEAVAVDGTGQVAVAGSCGDRGAVVFGASKVECEAQRLGTTLVGLLDGRGDVRWARSLPGDAATGKAVAFDGRGRVVLLADGYGSFDGIRFTPSSDWHRVQLVTFEP
jgi:hypothetical protein